MKNATKRILRSIGSILDLQPAGEYEEFRKLSSDYQMVGGDWKVVGDYLRESMKTYESKKTRHGCQN